MTTITTERINSIDIFRALTMLFMIFVNDLWTLHDVPGWLGHTKAEEDGMGFADVIFPAFLFIVGLSIPMAKMARKKKGEDNMAVMKHIIIRSAALIIMGYFAVNFENINREALPINKYVWELFMVTGFFLIWNNYKDGKAFGKVPRLYMVIIGVVILAVIAYIYKGGTVEAPHWMRTHWWGILGLIGWAYLVVSTFYLFAGHSLVLIVIGWALLNLLNVMEFASWAGPFNSFHLIVKASNHTLVMSGVLASALYLKYGGHKNKYLFPTLLLVLALITVVYGFSIRPHWGISKIRATPSWTTICAGMSYAVFAVIYIVADIFKLTRWANIISPAGKSTLTCYLVPYFFYPIITLLSIELPMYLRGGGIGLVKTFLFALLIIQITWVLGKVNVKLRV